MNKILKWVVIAGVLAIGVNVVRESMKASKEVDAKIAFASSCKRQAEKGDAVPPDKIDAVCTCVTGKTVKLLGPNGFIRLSTVTGATDADRQALMESMVSCMDELLPPK